MDIQPMTNEAKIAKLESEVEFLNKRTTSLENQLLEYKGLVDIYQAATMKVDKKLDQIYSALTGDALGNPGVIKRLAVIEEVVSWINTKKSTLVGVLAGVGAFAAAAYWVIQQIADWIK